MLHDTPCNNEKRCYVSLNIMRIVTLRNYFYLIQFHLLLVVGFQAASSMFLTQRKLKELLGEPREPREPYEVLAPLKGTSRVKYRNSSQSSKSLKKWVLFSPMWDRLITEQWLHLWSQNGSFSSMSVRFKESEQADIL